MEHRFWAYILTGTGQFSGKNAGSGSGNCYNKEWESTGSGGLEDWWRLKSTVPLSSIG